jgi:hypothetical protein
VQPPTTDRLRRGALAVSVLHDLDLLPLDDGVLLTGDVLVEVRWAECRRALAGAEPESEHGRGRLARWLLARRWVADTSAAELAGRVRPVGLPRNHLLHPGLDWVRERVLGGVLDVGLGVVGLDPARPDAVVVVPAGVLDAAGLDGDAWWPGAHAYLERMGGLAAGRWRRGSDQPLRPMGDCDVATLLASRALREELANSSGGMCPVVVPMRSRGWTELRRIDPAFSVAAAAATNPADRGFDRPLLVTADEVALVLAGGQPAVIELRDGTPAHPYGRDILSR